MTSVASWRFVLVTGAVGADPGTVGWSRIGRGTLRTGASGGETTAPLDQVLLGGDRAVRALGQAPALDRRWLPTSTSGTTQPAERRRARACAPRPGERRETLRDCAASLPIAPGSSRVTVFDDEEGRLAAGQHDVADAELAVDEVLADAVDTQRLHSNDNPSAFGELSGDVLIGTGDRRDRAAAEGGPYVGYRLDGSEDRPAFISMPVPPPNGASSTWRVHVGGVLPDVVAAKVEDTGLAGLAQQTGRAEGVDGLEEPRTGSTRTSPSSSSDRSDRRIDALIVPGRLSVTKTTGTRAPESSSSRSAAGLAAMTATHRPRRLPETSTTSSSARERTSHRVVERLAAPGWRKRWVARSSSSASETSQRCWCGRAWTVSQRSRANQRAPGGDGRLVTASSTRTSPRRPWARRIWPIFSRPSGDEPQAADLAQSSTNSMSTSVLSRAAAAYDGADALRGAPVPADHPAEVAGADVDVVGARRPCRRRRGCP